MTGATAKDNETVRVKFYWAGWNPDETKGFIMLDMKDTDQMKTLMKVRTSQEPGKMLALMFLAQH